MGLLIDGKWHSVDPERSEDGAFKREETQLRNWVTADGTAGPTGEGAFKAESGCYHLYVSLACPWAHRTLIFRKLKALEEHISVSIVSTDMLENGWTFDKATGSTGDPLNHFDYLYQVYVANDANYTGRVSVPVLWDKKQKRIVSNESSEIIRMFNTAFNEITNNIDDYYPKALRDQIDTINDYIYNAINNGVYRCGFATTQEAYEESFLALFQALDKIEELLGSQQYLVGEQITEADWRLFTTLIRFDVVYVGHFKCNKKRLVDYPNLSKYLQKLYQWPDVAETVDFHQIKRHYYFSQTSVNPTQIVPLGPDLKELFDISGL